MTVGAAADINMTSRSNLSVKSPVVTIITPPGSPDPGKHSLPHLLGTDEWQQFLEDQYGQTPRVTITEPTPTTPKVIKQYTQAEEWTNELKKMYRKTRTLPADDRRTTEHYYGYVPPSEESYGFCVNFSFVEGVPQVTGISGTTDVPSGQPTANDSERTGKRTEYELRVTLFDLTYKKFFGRTWVGPAKPIKTSSTQNARLQYNVPIYFHTSLNDNNIIAVVEIVGVITTKKNKIQRISCGWGIIRPFKTTNLGDLSSTTPEPVKRIDVYHGSPRALLYLDDDIEKNEKITLIAECTICYTIRTHKLMQKIMHILPENIICGPSEVIPGLAEQEGGDNLRRPRPVTNKIACVLDKLQIFLYPTVEKFEDEVCKLLNADRLARDDIQSDTGVVQVTERRLQVGIHNGWDYVQPPQTYLLTSDAVSKGGRGSMRRSKGRPASAGSKESLSTALLLKNKVKLELLDVPLYAIIFQLEYMLSVPLSTTDRKQSTSMNRTQSRQVALRWAAWTPFSQEGTSEVVLQLQGDPLPNPDGVFMFKNPEVEMSDVSVSKIAPGRIQFMFRSKDDEFADEELPMEVGPQQYQTGMDMHHEMNGIEGAVLADGTPLPSGRPPIYSAKSSPRTPRAYIGTPGSTGPVIGVSSMPTPQQHMYSSQPIYSSIQVVPPQIGNLYPVEIKHLEASTARNESPDQLTELPFTPVHAPIMPMGPSQHNGPSLTRAAYARLYQAGFPEIRDRDGDPPEVVDPNDYVAFHPQREDADPLQVNEIVLQFLAFSKIVQFEYPDQPKQHNTVFFTFQFYRYPQVTTERLYLGEVEGILSSDPSSLPCILKKLNKNGSVADGTPGVTMKYRIDPAYMKPEEGRLFVRHLYQQTLHIDVWDGDSLLLIGSCAVPLKNLLRNGRDAVQVTQELDVITTEYTEDSPALTGDMTRGGSVRPVGVTTILKGRLHLRMANIGYPMDMKMIKPGSGPRQAPKVVLQEDGSGAFLGGSLHVTPQKPKVSMNSMKMTRTYKAAHMADTDRELATALFARKDKAVLQDSNREADEVKKRKLSRMQAVRQQESTENGLISSLLVKKEEKIQRSRDLKTIEVYRERSKKEGIFNMLQSAITTEHTIHPSFGHAEFFEFILKNPYNVEHTVSIQIDEPELQLITDTREWRHYKLLTDTNTPVEENMFTVDENANVPGIQVFLRPKESIHVPFKYQSFKADHSVHPQGPFNPHRPIFKIHMPENDKKVDLSLKARNVKVTFKTQDNRAIAILSLDIEPQPHIIDQTFRFHHPEQSFLKKSVRLPPFQSIPGAPVGGPGLQGLFVRCSDDNVICETKRVAPGEPQDVFLKVACGASPSIKKFFVIIYADQFLSRPLQTWQFYVHALQRVDVSSVEGQTSRFSLILRGTQASRLVQCFSSHPLEMQISPADAFMLVSNSVHEIHVGVRPTAVGSKFMYINVVDTEYHQLIRSWLICVTCRQPIISKAFELQLPVGGGKGSNKRITYTNPYPSKKVFNLRCNRDDLLQFKETRIEIGAGETHTIGLRFSPSQVQGSAEILIFINDAEDKNEETFCVKAIYT
ncbi:nephrocystin-4-like isoform X2 [Ptychodera flava]|uniref:nephrocystin-4-like isoform X2 n=1 Tax=Ptychodera flava TaxID=63121 RepID=UPI003969EE8B